MASWNEVNAYYTRLCNKYRELKAECDKLEYGKTIEQNQAIELLDECRGDMLGVFGDILDQNDTHWASVGIGRLSVHIELLSAIIDKLK